MHIWTLPTCLGLLQLEHASRARREEGFGSWHKQVSSLLQNFLLASSFRRKDVDTQSSQLPGETCSLSYEEPAISPSDNDVLVCHDVENVESFLLLFCFPGSLTPSHCWSVLIARCWLIFWVEHPVGPLWSGPEAVLGQALVSCRAWWCLQSLT